MRKMNRNNRLQLYHKAILHWGSDAQFDMVFEETAELMSAVSRFRRGRICKMDVYEEMADVYIILEQLGYLLSNSRDQYDDVYNAIEQIKEQKLERVKKILGE